MKLWPYIIHGIKQSAIWLTASSFLSRNGGLKVETALNGAANVFYHDFILASLPVGHIVYVKVKVSVVSIIWHKKLVVANKFKI